MSGKLDQSLDEILKTSRPLGRGGRGGRGGRRTANTARTTTTAPVGGVQKNVSKQTRAKNVPVPSGPALANRESKVIISNFASDVNETMIKDYCNQTVGPVKRVTITYGPNGVSRGIVYIVFAKSESANICFSKMNDLVVDKRKLKVEIVVDASRTSSSEPLRSLTDRITNTKGQPKQATAVKDTTGKTAQADGTGRGGRGGRGGRRGRRGGRSGDRPKAKSAQELDADMTDYFVANGENPATTNGTSNPATNGGDAMDEVL